MANALAPMLQLQKGPSKRMVSLRETHHNKQN